MQITTEELMYNDFIKNHYRRMLLTIDSNIVSADMSDNEAKDDLIKIFNLKKSEPKIFKLPSLFYKISAVAAVLIVFVSFYFLQNKNNSVTQSSKVNSNTKVEINNTNTNQTIKKLPEKQSVIVSYDTIASPKYFSDSQEVFGFNQETNKQELDTKAFSELIVKKFPNYKFKYIESKLISRDFNIDNDYYRITLIKQKSEVIIVRSLSSKTIEAASNKEIEKFSNDLRRYLKEIAR